jgi:WD40 repeat protein
MEGSLTMIDLVTREVVAKVKDHNKYIVSLAWSPDGCFLTTLGYDKLVHVYDFSLSLSASPDTPALLDDEVPDPLSLIPTVSLTLAHTFATRTNPEAAVWLPDSKTLVWTAREDYLGAPDGGEKEWTTQSFNLNENGDAFVSFSMCVSFRLPIELVH